MLTGPPTTRTNDRFPAPPGRWGYSIVRALARCAGGDDKPAFGYVPQAGERRANGREPDITVRMQTGRPRRSNFRAFCSREAGSSPCHGRVLSSRRGHLRALDRRGGRLPGRRRHGEFDASGSFIPRALRCPCPPGDLPAFSFPLRGRRCSVHGVTTAIAEPTR